MLSDHGQTQGATFKQRNGYGLDELVARSLEHGADVASGGRRGREPQRASATRVGEATGSTQKRKRPKNDVSDRDVVVLGSGNLGLVYLMDERRRLTPRGDRRAASAPAARPARASARRLAARPLRARRAGRARRHAGRTTSPTAASRATTRSPHFSPNAPRHLLRTDGFEHVADIMVGSFYDPALDEGCAFEELISFHGGIGGAQTRPFLLAPVGLPLPEEPIVGAAAVHGVLSGWRRQLNGSPEAEPQPRRRGSAVISAPQTRGTRVARLRAAHSYGLVLGLIIAVFVFTSVAPNSPWADSTLVLLQSLTLVTALWTSGVAQADSKISIGLVALATTSAVALLVFGGTFFKAVVLVLAGLLTIATILTVALGDRSTRARRTSRRSPAPSASTS